MKWMRFRVRTNEESEDIIVSYLEDIGLEGAQIEDNAPLTAQDKEQMFIDAPELEPDDNGEKIESGVAYLNFFLEIDDNNMLTVELPNDEGEYEKVLRTPEEMQAAIRQKLDELKEFSDIGDGTISIDVTEDIDWINNWKQYFHKFYIDDILVIPSWEKENAEDRDKASMVLHMDPGTAFGTGKHETTQLCIRMLKKYVTKDTELLDVGTGSGVLSILALMMGAKHAVGTDLDKCAVPAVKENMENNGIAPDQFEMMIGDITVDKATQDAVGYDKYDIVVANILANVLVPLTPVILSQLKKGGIYITSGIINTKEEEVKKAHLDAGLEILEIHHQGDWVSITSRKN
ncbi:50S ribosomal protein L11 methyltransferase [Butyrivibrio sp. FCS014]|uniref:50S ribosomal protein L11 methyltransferase n=1 Tax=Butyrivibrio sp. FCS014 TaxID=1408304 RepID=UPI00046799E2|nr:50S ribosomal protein L11 methyltransferase [Butyrivibrio sp. FCS014]